MTQRRINQVEYPYFVTANTAERIWLFEDTQLTEQLSAIIMKACQLKCATLYAYCIMPDHVHLLVWMREDSPYNIVRFDAFDQIVLLSGMQESYRHFGVVLAKTFLFLYCEYGTSSQ
ncbi:hypothetical protein AUK40_04390 [Candidatus Wirthbacteria bacterium CG2_30_54_11]|uniref:Transposase IS200-like domain-containing protein n=1 Tax=Candidatus Wirthbacteria bacterium CG2_30_54_11 TaxID=1817892 RepID=A0A1J5IR72_9BACT|nr:MAG: hypothetical protein AUK40_04390 [Candidatus Wirthbacteria bacterium CG2_30_54_11]